MITEKEIALFDDYISGDLSKDQKLEFESKLNADAGLNAKFERHKNEVEQIAKAGELIDFRKQLKGIHQNLYPKKKIFILQPKFLAPIGIAAVLLVGFFVLNNIGFLDGGTSNEDYNELAYNVEETVEAVDDNYSFEMDSMVEEETVPEKVYSDSTSSTPTASIISRQPKGTAFMIDVDGYFLTSKHLTKGKKTIQLQQRDIDLAFNATVIYEDSLLDFAIVKAESNSGLELKKVPYRLSKGEPSLGDEVFTLGFTKQDIVYTKGDISSLSGYKGDKDYIEVSMPANAGNSGAPLFSTSGEFFGIITANNSKKQSVTYVMNHLVLNEKLIAIQSEAISFGIMTKTMKRYKTRKDIIKDFKPFIFEVH